MNTAQASHLVFEYLLKEEFHCEGVHDLRNAANGVVCPHNLREAHEVQIPDMERDVWFIYKAELAFMELPEAYIKVFRRHDNNSFVVSTRTLTSGSTETERTLLKAKLMAFAVYVYNSFTNEQIAQFQKENI